MNNLISRGRMFPLMSDNAFNEFMDDFFGKPSSWIGKEKSVYPMNVIRIIKNDEVMAYRLEYALAGFNKENIKISVVGNILKIDAAIPVPEATKIVDEDDENEINEVTVYNGISYRSMSLSYKLMENADKKNITSKFENGLLKITIPAKVETVDFNSIEIE